MVEDEADRRGGLVRDLLTGAFLATGVIYLAWIPTALNPDAPIFAAVFYLGEVVGFLAALLRFYVTRRAPTFPKTVSAPPPLPIWPEVDIFITTYKEPLAMVRRTLAAAMGIRGRGEVWLLDDGNRAEMAALAGEFGCRYLPRATNDGAKAGNLNNGLAHAKGEYVACFDADHIAEPRFLEVLMGYFADPKVAMAQTPQDYFNTDSFQHGHGKSARGLWHEQSVFHWVQQPGREHLGAVTCCGCSMVLRRSALDDIGQFPTETVTEDMHAAVKLHKKGWVTHYHAEPLAFGVAAASAKEFLRQRQRWGEGNMQVCRLEGIPFSRSLTRGQNLGYLVLGTTYLEAWIKLINYTAPIIFLFFLVPPLWSDLGAFMMVLTPYLICALFCCVEFGRGFTPFLQMERFSMARLSAGLAATGGLFRRRIQFRVTSKAVGGEHALLVMAPQAAILLMSLAGLGHLIWRVAEGGWFAPAGVTIAIALLAVYNSCLAGWVLTDALRAANLPDEAWACPEPIPFRFQGDNALRAATRLSADVLTAPGGPHSGGAVILYLPGDAMVAEAAPVDGQAGAWRLSWPSAQARDAFEIALLGSAWRRPLAGRVERCWTWLETLRLLPPPWPRGAEPRPYALGVWRTEGSREERLAAVAEDEAVLFGPPASSTVTIETPDGRLQARLAPPIRLAPPDFLAVVAQGGRRYALREIERSSANS